MAPPELRLDRLVGDGTGALDAIDPSHDFPCVARYARGLGEGPVGPGLHHPQIGVRRSGLPQCIIDQTSVDARDDDHDPEQQAQAKGGEHEAQEIVLDIAISEVHRLCTCAILAARPTRRPLRKPSDDRGVVRHAAGDFVTSVKQPMAEHHLALLQSAILHRPHRSRRLAERFNCRFWHEQRLRKMVGGDVDLRLFAQIEILAVSH